MFEKKVAKIVIYWYRFIKVYITIEYAMGTGIRLQWQKHKILYRE